MRNVLHLEGEWTAADEVLADFQGHHDREIARPGEVLAEDVAAFLRQRLDLRPIEVKDLAAAAGSIPLAPNGRRADRRERYLLDVVMDFAVDPELRDPAKNPVGFPWREAAKVQHCRLEVDLMAKRMRQRRVASEYDGPNDAQEKRDGE